MSNSQFNVPGAASSAGASQSAQQFYPGQLTLPMANPNTAAQQSIAPAQKYLVQQYQPVQQYQVRQHPTQQIHAPIQQRAFMPGQQRAPVQQRAHLQQFPHHQPRPVGQPQAPTQNRPPVKELLRQKSHVFAPMIHSAEDLEALKREHHAMNNVAVQQTAAYNEGYPMTPETEQECVKKLFLAIVDFSAKIEKDSDYQYKRIKNLSNFEVHCAAWDILLATQRAHRGELGFAERSWDREWKYEVYASFDERFNAVVECCRRSTSMVYGDLKASFINRIASAPVKEIGRKTANTILNDKRAGDIKAGKEAKKAKEPKQAPKATAALTRTHGGRVTKSANPHPGRGVKTYTKTPEQAFPQLASPQVAAQHPAPQVAAQHQYMAYQPAVPQAAVPQAFSHQFASGPGHAAPNYMVGNNFVVDPNLSNPLNFANDRNFTMDPELTAGPEYSMDAGEDDFLMDEHTAIEYAAPEAAQPELATATQPADGINNQTQGTIARNQGPRRRLLPAILTGSWDIDGFLGEDDLGPAVEDDEFDPEA